MAREGIHAHHYQIILVLYTNAQDLHKRRQRVMAIDTTKENLQRLTDMHLRRYSNRLRAAKAGVRGYRQDELQHLITLWEEVRHMDHDFSKLSKPAVYEVLDAIQDEGE